jgi:WhiB family redox-sensing transcriptional regulator
MLGSIGSTPHTNTGPAQNAVSARPQLSVVPDHSEFESATEEDDQWQERALCAQTDPEAFFPEKGGSTREAKRICLGCEVRDECLDYALANDERFGIWGGLSERERRRLKRGII